jgi:hypothetical protein
LKKKAYENISILNYGSTTVELNSINTGKKLTAHYRRTASHRKLISNWMKDSGGADGN